MAFVESTCSQGTYYPPAHSEPLGNILFVIFEKKEVVKKKIKGDKNVHIEIKH